MKRDVVQTERCVAAAYRYRGILEILSSRKFGIIEVNNLEWLATHGTALNGHGDIIKAQFEDDNRVGLLQENFGEAPQKALNI